MVISRFSRLSLIRLLSFCFFAFFVPLVVGQEPRTVCSIVQAGEPVQELIAKVPALGKDAGKYYPISSATRNVTACILACCLSDDCHVAFVFNGTICYKISCNSKESCNPVSSESEQHAKSVFVWVREPKTGSLQEPTKTAIAASGTSLATAKKSLYGRVCGDSLDPCPPPFACITADTGKICACPKGTLYDQQNDTCKTLAPVTGTVKDFKPKACEEDLHQCGGDNEKCKYIENSKKGWCICIDGYVRSNSSGQCVSTKPKSLAQTKMAPNPKSKTPLNVVIEGPKTVQLPVESVQLIATLTGESAKVTNLTYYWEVLKGDSGLVGYVDSFAKADFTMTRLKMPGTITLQVTVSNDDYIGIREFTLEVLAEKKPNVKPKALIRPDSPVQGTTGNKVVLDAEGSSDEDGKIAAFSWKLLKGPVVPLPAMTTGTLTLDRLVAGNYSFSLTVTDDQGADDEATVEVLITEERDDPPIAMISRCGESGTGSINVRLPLAALFLCGNGSKDDMGPVTYKWFRIDELIKQLPVDQTGTNQPVLKLAGLVANEKFGPYQFKLEVTDSKGQKDETTFSVFVSKAENQKPVPDAGANQTVELPTTSAIVDGTVTDDGSIEKYSWTQISGPSRATITNQDKPKATMSDLMEGVYQFRLNVTDDGGLTATDDIFITVTRSKNEPPKAIADNVAVTLPMSVAILNGSKSTDDAGVVSYKWTPMDDVPACMIPLGGSDSKPVLMVSNLLPGEFVFNLTVADLPGITNTIAVKLTVESGSVRNHSIELYLNQPVEKFTYGLRNKLQQRLAAALLSLVSGHTVDVKFTEIGVDPTSGRLRIVFHALYTDENENKQQVIIGEHAVKVLREEKSMLEEFQVDSIDTFYCLSTCSGHGVCSHFSKECVCDKFWMPNLFSAYVLGRKRDNCSWSILYFTIILILIVSTVGGTLWMMLCAGEDRKNNSWCRSRTARRRKRYRLLDDSQSPPRIAMKSGKGGGKLTSALLVSTDSNASESETEEILYSRDEAIKRKAPTTEVKA